MTEVLEKPKILFDNLELTKELAEQARTVLKGLEKRFGAVEVSSGTHPGDVLLTWLRDHRLQGVAIFTGDPTGGVAFDSFGETHDEDGKLTADPSPVANVPPPILPDGDETSDAKTDGKASKAKKGGSK